MRYLFFVLFMGSVTANFGQNLSMALAEDHPKSLVVQKVYRNILAVANNQQYGSLPTIEVIQRKRKPAAYSPHSNTIRIEEITYDLCASLGSNRDAALAILIGHEFTHFSKKHSGTRGFACDYYDHAATLKYASIEEEADFWGLFTAYLAGYDVTEVSPNLLAKIYEKYGLKEEMTGYPALKVRQQLGDIAIKKLEEFIQLYEAGNFLTAVGAYEQAASCYGTILETYQSGELHNNMGVSLIRQALAVAPKGDYPFVYPLELEVTSRLYRYKKPPFGFDPKQLVISYLQKAIVQLEAALKTRSNYVATKLNLAIAQEMLGQISIAKETISTIDLAQLTTNQQAHLSILKGIITAREGDSKQSFLFFKQAGNHSIAQLNSQILEGFAQPIVPKTTFSPTLVSMDGIQDLRRVHNFQISFPLNTQSNSSYYQPKYQFQYSLLPNSVLWKIGRTKKLEQALLQLTKNPVAFTTHGLQVGSPRSAILSALGSDSIHTGTSQGEFLYYPAEGLVFLLNNKGIVQQWGKVLLIGL